MDRGVPAPSFQLTAIKYECLLPPSFLFLKQISVFIVITTKGVFLKTNSHVKRHKIEIYIILLAVHDLFKNVLEYVIHIKILR